MNKLYLIEYSIRDIHGLIKHSKLAVEADDMKEAIKQALAMPRDESEGQSWIKDLKQMETFNATFYCYK